MLVMLCHRLGRVSCQLTENRIGIIAPHVAVEKMPPAVEVQVATHPLLFGDPYPFQRCV